MKRACLLLTLILLAGVAEAAEIVVRGECVAAGSLVTLGQIATVHSSNPVEVAEYSAMDLLPAPASGESRTLRVRELQDMLAVRGVNLRDLRFSGASQVSIRGAAIEAPKTKRVHEPFVPTAPVRKPSTIGLTEQVRTKIAAYLQQQTEREDWIVEAKLAEKLLAQLAEFGEFSVVAGGAEPWIGEQAFTLQSVSGGKSIELTVEVSTPTTIVVAKRSMPKGVILQADDVCLQPGLPTKGEAHVYQSIDEVIGLETTRQIGEKQVLDDKAIRRPLLVKRGEVVTVYSRSPGVTVRITARSRDDGGKGDLVSVETIGDRQHFLARVSGMQQVEVFAQAATIESRDDRPRPSAAPSPVRNSSFISKESK